MARRAAGFLVLSLCGLSAAAAQASQAAGAEVSENPVRGNQVVISWPSAVATSSARVFVFSFTGEQLFTTTVPPSTNEYVWDLMLGGSRRVVNGVYIIVVDVAGQRYRRRLFVARPGP